ncbi:MAG TPA: TetR/AcrR family transcriptional regulator [Mycobacteriales bacterium]
MGREAGVRARAAAESRARVLDAARTVLSDPAGQAWGMETVAAAAGVTRMTVYNQFGSRTALIEAVLDQVVARDRMDRLVDGTSDLDPADALHAALVTTCRFWHAERPLLHRLFAIAEPAVEDLLARREGWRREQLGALLGRADPALRKDDAVLDTVVAVTSFPAYDRLGVTADAPEVAADILHRMLGGLLLPATDTRRRRAAGPRPTRPLTTAE